MEALWEDLSREEDSLSPPACPQSALAQTEQATAAGEAHFIDWERAKKLLRDTTP